jgi:hypothetical protein
MLMPISVFTIPTPIDKVFRLSVNIYIDRSRFE